MLWLTILSASRSSSSRVTNHALTRTTVKSLLATNSSRHCSSSSSGITSRSISSSSSSSSSRQKGGSLILCRHGQSTWNEENLFTGWADVPLTKKGEGEAKEAGRLIKAEMQKEALDIKPELVYTSVLQRAIKTLWLALEEMDMMWLPVINTWRLNERHYGALQGLNKAETAQKYGEEQVMEWRRSFDIPPPEVDETSEHFPGNDIRYENVPKYQLPKTESLKLTGERFLPEWETVIGPQIASGKDVMIVAHGNSLRALVKHLDNISEQDILKLNIPTGVPLVYKLDGNLKSIPQPGAIAPLTGRYLGDPEEIAKAAQAVANQAGGKKH